MFAVHIVSSAAVIRVVTQRFSLRDDPNNGCEGDYGPHYDGKFENGVFTLKTQQLFSVHITFKRNSHWQCLRKLWQYQALISMRSVHTKTQSRLLHIEIPLIFVYVYLQRTK